MGMEESKTCTGCNKNKPISDFPFRKDRQKYATRCRDCINARDRKARNGTEEYRMIPKAPDPFINDDGEEVKECTKCNENLPLSEFHFRKARSQYYAHCKGCHRGIVSEYAAENADHLKAKSKESYERIKSEDPDRLWGYRLWHAHGLTVERYHSILEKQGGVCVICGSDDPQHSDDRAKKVRFVVDHDHDCCPEARSCGNCIRGLVCHPCNRLMGQAHDDPDILIKAAAYLMSYNFEQGKGVVP